MYIHIWNAWSAFSVGGDDCPTIPYTVHHQQDDSWSLHGQWSWISQLNGSLHAVMALCCWIGGLSCTRIASTSMLISPDDIAPFASLCKFIVISPRTWRELHLPSPSWDIRYFCSITNGLLPNHFTHIRQSIPLPSFQIIFHHSLSILMKNSPKSIQWNIHGQRKKNTMLPFRLDSWITMAKFRISIFLAIFQNFHHIEHGIIPT